MASNNNQPIVFVVPGRSQAAGATRGGGSSSSTARTCGLPGRLRESVQVGAMRAGGAPVRVSATPGQDVVALHIANGPVLLLHPATARDLMLAQGSTTRGKSAAAVNEVAVPVQLRWAGLEQAAPARTRGFLGDVVLSMFEVLTGFATEPAAKFVAGEVVRRFDAQVEAGVYRLSPDALGALKGSGRKVAAVTASAEPMLVLIHGTFTETASTFGKLWAQHPQRVRDLFDHYGGRVYALDHPTLGATPVANALTLVQALPAGARVHLLTHSRGGLVAEVLARVASQRDIGAADLAFFPGASYANARHQLQDLAKAMREKDIKVERVVRVACPARGTLLASGRLDAYLSVLKWTIELAGLQVAPELLGFIAEVARRRANPAEIPGLEAQIPGTPLLNWLNAAPAGIAGDLRVVAGDLEGDSLGSWLKTLLADGFYWTDNDIVVQTRSMYGGAPRLGGATFLLDRGAKVSHFAYFANQRTVDAVVEGLIQGLPPAGFGPIGLLSWSGKDSSGQRAAAGPISVPGTDGTRPAVFVLPGILGSNLAVNKERIWLGLHLVAGLGRLAYHAGSDDVKPDGAIGVFYGELTGHLGASHDVVEFAFDWRRPIEDEARRLGAAVGLALDARQASGQPVRILAHSMGGLLARTMALKCPAVWARMMAHADARLLMLGTPNAGSWAPMQVLSGDDTLGNTLVAFGSPLADHAARQMMAAMPGFLQLQAGLLDPVLALDKTDTWVRLAADDLAQMQQKNWWHGYAGEAQEAAYRWGVPAQPVLDQARALRVQLDAQLQGDFKAWAGKTVLVVGAAQFTPDGFEVGSAGFEYRNAVAGGDGRVPLASALLPGVATWALGCDHGSLPCEKSAFDGYVELLETGSTTKLDALAVTRASIARPEHQNSRPARARPSSRPAETERDVFRSGDGTQDSDTATADTGELPLRVRVLNGNLTFVRPPLMIGHYRALELTGTEAVIDRQVGGAMRIALSAGLYPDLTLSSRIFVNTLRQPDDPFQAPRPQAAIVVGLGDEGNLSTQQLVATVRQGTIAWAQRAAEMAGAGSPAGTAAGAPAGGREGFEIAATLIGSGGPGVSAGSAARAIAQGVREANLRLAGSGWPQVARLTLVELYLDRATEAWRGLQVLATASPRHYRIEPLIAAGTGPLRRQLDNGYRGTSYDLISATSGEPDGDDGNRIYFALDTKRARTEVHAQSTQRKLITDLVRNAATATASEHDIGRTLFQLLVPAELEPFLAGEDSMVLELDAGTAPIPWELLNTSAAPIEVDGTLPWAIRTRLLRKLRKANFRNLPQDASADDAVLVIGEPLIADDKGYPRLPGAAAEGLAVRDCLAGPGGLDAEHVTALLDQPDAAQVINALLARCYRIVHIAGHGEPVETDGDGKVLRARGVVLSDDVFLGAAEIKAMRTVPELVFINCCHLGGHAADLSLRNNRPGAFAANVADALIEIGVRCVVAAGWAVGDAAAEAFATTFYRELLHKSDFITAVHEARLAARRAEPEGKTWAAYQCYGDPGWVLRSRVGDAQAGPARHAAPADEGAGIASPAGLALALEEIAVRLRYMGARAPEQQAALQALELRFGAIWGEMGAVAEAFGVAWAALSGIDARAQAIAWYERALAAEDASASIKVQEQLGNLRVRAAWVTGRRAQPDSADFEAALGAIEAARQDLRALAEARPTVERLSLCGSASKRLALMHARRGAAEVLHAARVATHADYADAEALAAQRAGTKLYYAGLNRIGAELVLGGADAGLDAAATEAAHQSLLAASASEPDFWSEAARIEFAYLMAVAGQRLAGSLADIRRAFVELHLRMDAHSNWQSVADTAEFVLGAYRGWAGADDRAAADALLALLAEYAP